MFRRIFKWTFVSSIAVLLIAAIFVTGFIVSRFDVDPFRKFANRVERKLTELSGGPSQTEQRVGTVESTFLRFAGEVYEMPGNDWINGGGLAVWEDELLVLHRSGRILRFIDGEGLTDTSIATPEAGQEAYAELAASEAYANYTHKPNKMRFNDLEYVDDPLVGRGLAVSYTFFDPERLCYGTQIAWLPIDDAVQSPAELSASQDDWEIVFETNPCLDLNPSWTALDGLAAGGRIAYSAPGKLILGSGEYHLDGVHTYDVGIQDDDNDYGKVIEIDMTDWSSRHISKGHRNMQGVAVDREGQIWVTEHGLRGGDELNLVKEGGNYGWPLETLGTLYSGQPFPSEGEVGRHTLETPPTYAWLPSAAVSSLAALDGFDETWDGDLIAGSLSSQEFGQSLFHIRVRDERVVFVERIKLRMRIRYLTQFGPDRLALWMDTNELVILTIEERADPLGDVIARLEGQYPEELAGRIGRMLNNCGECHSYEQSNHASAPSLNGVVGRRIGESGYRNYSEALQAKSGVWNAETLKSYLLDPNAFAEGTSMPNPGVVEGDALDGLIWALEELNTTDDTHLKYN